MSGRASIRRWLTVLGCTLAATVLPGAAFAAGGGDKVASEAIFVIQIVLLLLIGRGLGEAMQRIGQPSIMGQLLAGILLGPSVFGLVWPSAQQAIFPPSPEQKSMIEAFSQFGILMLLLLTGMETDLALVRKVRRAAICVSIAGVTVPFACGFALGEVLPSWMLPNPDQRLVTSLFLGTALSISSVKIVATVVREMDFMRRNIGQVIVASAIMEDTIGWVIVAITLGLATHGEIALGSVAGSVVGTAAFLIFSFTFGRRIVFALIRWSNDTFVSEYRVITMILIIMGVMALITDLIGVHTVLGAFIAGVLVGESPILTRQIEAQVRGLVVGLFMPVFFGLAGLNANLTILADTRYLLLIVLLIAIASVGKFAGAFAGGMVGGLSNRESFALANGMNARGSTEVIVASIGLSMGALNQALFTMIVGMAVSTTMAMPPALRWALARLPMKPEERERLEREAMDAKGFVSKLERLLLAVDDSANGRFASRLAGLLAGSRGLPTTALGVQPHFSPKADVEAATAAITEEIKAAAKIAAAQVESSSGEEKPREVDITTRTEPVPTEQAVATEASKGYDLLIIGVEQTAADGGFSRQVERIAAGFEGPMAIVSAGSASAGPAAHGSLDMLVPVNGTDVSRRATEVAFALARSSRSHVTALYVANRRGGRGGRGGNADGKRQARASRRDAEAVLKDVLEMADRYDVDLQTRLQASTTAAKAILRAAERDRHDLIVIGVGRRSGDRLFFGDTAAAVLHEAKSPTLLLSS